MFSLSRPFVNTVFVVETSAEIKLELAKEEQEDARRGVLSAHEISPSLFITQGFDLEECQCVSYTLYP